MVFSYGVDVEPDLIGQSRFLDHVAQALSGRDGPT